MSGTLYFTSARNALKRATSGTLSMAAPVTSAYSGTLYVTNTIIPHGLGYTPLYRYYYEPFGDGIIWPCLTDRLAGEASKPTNTAIKGPGFIAWADNTNIYLQLFHYTNSLTGTFPVYYVTYRDFQLN